MVIDELFNHLFDTGHPVFSTCELIAVMLFWKSGPLLFVLTNRHQIHAFETVSSQVNQQGINLFLNGPPYLPVFTFRSFLCSDYWDFSPVVDTWMMMESRCISYSTDNLLLKHFWCCIFFASPLVQTPSCIHICTLFIPFSLIFFPLSITDLW